MMFVEVFTPRGTLNAEQRRQIGERLLADLMNVPEAPASVIEAGRALCQVVVHEPDVWTVGGKPVGPESAPRYVVRASVPGGWAADMSDHLIKAFTATLADIENDAERLFRESDAWVQVVAMPDGAFGTLGKAMTSNDVVRMMTQAFREGADGELPAPPPGKAIDPICGMTVPLSGSALTLEHEGETFAFCSHGCRAVFAEDQGIAIPA